MTVRQLDPTAKKSVLRSFTYGLYAVSATQGRERGIFTANWLSQVSFDPPLVMVSVERESATLPIIRESERFTVAPFATGSRALAGNLGRPRKRTGDKFDAYGFEIVETPNGDITIADAVGYVVCELRSETSAGDSVVLIGEVVAAKRLRDLAPLTMSEAGFRHSG